MWLVGLIKSCLSSGPVNNACFNSGANPKPEFTGIKGRQGIRSKTGAKAFCV